MKMSVAIAALALAAASTRAGAVADKAQIAAYLQPFAATDNLSGSVMVVQGRKVLFAKSYGFADLARRMPNGPNTRFHVASMSIPFTSTAVLRLIDQGKLAFDTRVSEIVPGVPNGDKITIRNLLVQNSNLPDVNDDLPDAQYQALMNSHQTPQIGRASRRERVEMAGAAAACRSKAARSRRGGRHRLFQAGDGIRGGRVTGVQTCALPISFDTRVSEIVPGVPNGDKITIRNLLVQNSNLPDVNDDLPDAQYQALMNSHQTP